MSKCISPLDNFKTNNRILVIGDLHADYKKTVDLFIYFNLININKKWTGGNTIIVQLGDQIDGYGRGSYEDASGEIEILNLFDDIHIQASREGGGVYSIIGNHELMNVMGNFSYASKEDIKKNGGTEKRRELYKPGGSIAKRLSCTRNTILKINDIIFVHGGIIPDLVKENKEMTIKIVNKLMRDFFNGKIDESHIDFSRMLKDSNSVLWDRSLGKTEVNCSLLDETLENLNAKHIVIGHSPQDIINSKCSQKVWRVDVGLSKSLGNNKYQVLEITKNKHNTYNFKVLT